LKKNIEDVKKIVVSLSGGLDSTTLLYLAVSKLGKENVYALSFDYNQRHDVELKLAKETCRALGVTHKIIDLGFLGDIVSGVSAMVKGTVKTPTFGEVNAAKEVKTYVPFRNSILSSVTFAFAEAVGADGIALGVQYGDYENNDAYYYWDCSKAFTETMQQLADLNDKHKISYVTPFVDLTKKDEIELGLKLGIDYADTWTCYNPTLGEVRSVGIASDPMGGKNNKAITFYKPCGICPSCVGRIESFKELGLKDPQQGVWI